MSISGGMDEEMVVYSYSVKRRSTIKKNKSLIHATEGMNLKKLKMLVKEANHQPDDSILCETLEKTRLIYDAGGQDTPCLGAEMLTGWKGK